jgi:arylsulfatase A-like enzyme
MRIGIMLLLSLYLSCMPGNQAPVNVEYENVILIAIDSLRVDRCGFMGGVTGQTDNLDKLALRSVVFEDCYTPISLSGPSLTATLTGWDPLRSGIIEENRVWDPGMPSLVSRFAPSFYTSGIPASYKISGDLGYDEGFMMYTGYGYGTFPDRTRNEIIEVAFKDLQNNWGVPTFVMIHFYDTNIEFDRHLSTSAPRFIDVNTPSPVGLMPIFDAYNNYNYAFKYTDAVRAMDLYEAGIYDLDKTLGDFLNQLERDGYFNDSLIVIWALHGESLGENHYYGYGGCNEQENHVPLLMHFPGDQYGGTRVPGLTSVIDILPTVLDAFAIPLPESVNGISQLPRIIDPTLPGRDVQFEIATTTRPLVPYYVFDGTWRTSIDSLQ